MKYDQFATARLTKPVLALTLVVAGFASPSFAFGPRKPAPPVAPAQALSNQIRVTEVELTRKNALATGSSRTTSCERFLGTHAGNTIQLEVSGQGGTGDYEHTVVYTLNSSYQHEGASAGQSELSRRGNGTLEITLPELRDEIPFVQQTLFLATRDRAGAQSTTTITFLVARTVILQVSPESIAREKNCFQRYEAFEGPTGALSNGSTNPSTVQIRQGLQKIWTSTKGWSFGVWFSPLSFLGLGNLFSLNATYFTETSRQTIETVEVVSGYELNPGDFLQLYIQPTRYITAYDATQMDACGTKNTLPGSYLFQWWGFSYHVYPIDPRSTRRPPSSAVGAPPVNTCPADLDPITQGAGPSGTIEFRGTN